MNAPQDYQELKDTLTCPSCEGKISSKVDLQNPQPVKKGNIMVCGHCGTICVVGDSNLVKMKKEEFAKLDKQSKFLIGVSAASVLAKGVNERNKNRRIIT